MKSLKLLILVISLVAMSATGASSQTIKRNQAGQKLIKRITADWIQVDGTVHPGNNHHTYDMTYFPDGQLKSITLSFRGDGGNIYGERLSVEADTIGDKYLINGRPNPTASAIVKSHKDNRMKIPRRVITCITRKAWEKEPSCDYIHRFCDVFFHERYRTLHIELIGAEDNIEALLQNVRENGSKGIFTHTCGRSDWQDIYPNTNFKDAGFNREICWFENNDGYMYYLDETKERLRQEQDGNLLSNHAGPLNYNLGDIFTDFTNDTNMNLQFFFEFEMPELMTEWVPVRSKNLIRYENADKFADGIHYKKYWEYEHDSAGNLIGATAIRKDEAPHSKYRIKIEYVYE